MKRTIILLIIVITVLFLVPSVALAADVNGDGYNDNDFNKMQAFLDQPSDIGGQTNGEAMNPAYDRLNPLTWFFLIWSTDTERRLTEILSSDTSLAGALDASGCDQLNYVRISENKITSLNLSGDTALQVLLCNDNLLSSLDISGDSALQDINCESNNLTSLNASTSTVLQKLACDNNQITSLNLPASAVLDEIDCNGNALTALDVSANPGLTKLHFKNSALTALDLSHNPLLQEIDCSGNVLTALDVSHNPALQTMDCSGNALTALDVSHNPALYGLACSNNALHSLDLTNCPNMTVLMSSGNALTRIDAQIFGASVSLNAVGNGTVELYANAMVPDYYATAVPGSPSPFVSWTASGSQVSTNTKYDLTIGSSYNLDANFNSPSNYTVTFDSNEGDANAIPATVNANSGDKISAPATPPTRTGYTFGGWYKDQACKTAWDFNTDTVIGSMTLYAKWTAQPAPTPSVTPSVTAASTENLSLFSGGRIKLKPTPSGGTWYWDKNFVSLTQNSDGTVTIKGLREGSTTVRYTYGYGENNYTVTIGSTKLPVTGQDFAGVYILIALAACALGTGILIGFFKRRKHA